MAFVPYDYGGEFPDDFFDRITGETEEGWYVDYPDTNENGYADFYDEWLGNPDIELRPSQGHAGA